MPNRNVVFPEAEVRRWGHYGGGPTDEQLVRFFTLSPADLGRADRARSGSSRLGYVVQLGTVRFLAAFLADVAETPEVVLRHLAAQVDADPASWADYVGSRARLVHQGAIRRDYGYAVFGAGARHVAFLRWLWGRAWTGDDPPACLVDLATGGWSNIRCFFLGSASCSAYAPVPASVPSTGRGGFWSASSRPNRPAVWNGSSRSPTKRSSRSWSF